MSESLDWSGVGPPREEVSPLGLPVRPSREQILALARKHIIMNGSHEMCDYVGLVRAALKEFAKAEKPAESLEAIGRDYAIDFTPTPSEFVQVPVLQGFDATRPIGWLRLRRDALPPTPDFVFSLGFAVNKADVADSLEVTVTDYTLQCVSLLADQMYLRYLENAGKAGWGFIIANPERTRWRTMDSLGMPDWTDDPAEALCFSLRKHADAFAADDPADVRIFPTRVSAPV